jgi:hypothetical protein
MISDFRLQIPKGDDIENIQVYQEQGQQPGNRNEAAGSFEGMDYTSISTSPGNGTGSPTARRDSMHNLIASLMFSIASS